MTIAFVSVEEFTASCVGLDLGKYTPLTLSGVLTRATAKAESFIERTLAYETITDEKKDGFLNSNGDIEIFPSKYPVRSVSSIAISKGTYSTNLTLVDGSSNLRYDIPSSEDRIVVSGDTITFDTVSVLDLQGLRNSEWFTKTTYSAGFYMYDRPQDIIDAISLIGKDEISRSYNATGASEIRQGGVAIKYANKKGKSDFILDAEALLAPYIRVTP